MWLQAWGSLLLTGAVFAGDRELWKSIKSTTDGDKRNIMFLYGQVTASVFSELPLSLKKTVQDVNVCIDGSATEFVDGLWNGRGNRLTEPKPLKVKSRTKEENNQEEIDVDKGSSQEERKDNNGLAVALWELKDYLDLLNASNSRVGASYVLVGPFRWLKSRMTEVGPNNVARNTDDPSSEVLQ
ncbi:uncharacterized protein LOC143027937 [Oratosquilla oratoria]|uniref:uncharacterized protein LOC143027937 n=1 Tax=Oratosquilla oratoria TaxID=337810 RepID=UPI003F7726EC